MASSSIPPVLLSASFPRNPDRFVLVGSPFIPQLQTLAKAYPNPALPLPAPIPIILKKKNLVIDEGRGEMVETVYLRLGIDTLYLPLLDTLDIEHFIGCQGNHALRQIALVVGDIESLSISPPPLSPAAHIIFGLPQLETVYAVECVEIGSELHKLLSWREKNPEKEWEMIEVPEIVPGPPPGDAMIQFGGYRYPDKPWDTRRKALVERHWEEQMAGRAGSKPRLECRSSKRKFRQPPVVM
jgi:hypothetical protein